MFIIIIQVSKLELLTDKIPVILPICLKGILIILKGTEKMQRSNMIYMILKEISTFEIEAIARSSLIVFFFFFFFFLLWFYFGVYSNLDTFSLQIFSKVDGCVSLTILKFITSTHLYLCTAVNIVWIFLQLVLLSLKGWITQLAPKFAIFAGCFLQVVTNAVGLHVA